MIRNLNDEVSVKTGPPQKAEKSYGNGELIRWATGLQLAHGSPLPVSDPGPEQQKRHVLFTLANG
jgi:hypothetical protein